MAVQFLMFVHAVIEYFIVCALGFRIMMFCTFVFEIVKYIVWAGCFADLMNLILVMVYAVY